MRFTDNRIKTGVPSIVWLIPIAILMGAFVTSFDGGMIAKITEMGGIVASMALFLFILDMDMRYEMQASASFMESIRMVDDHQRIVFLKDPGYPKIQKQLIQNDMDMRNVPWRKWTRE